MAASSTPIHGSPGRLEGVAARLRPGRRCARPRDSSLLRTAGLLPDLVDLIDQVEEFLGLAQIDGRFRLRALRDGLLQNVLELRELRVMLLRLVPVAPENVEMVLRQLRPLLFDQDRPPPAPSRGSSGRCHATTSWLRSVGATGRCPPSVFSGGVDRRAPTPRARVGPTPGPFPTGSSTRSAAGSRFGP